MMEDMEKKLAFLLATSPCISLAGTYGTYARAVRDLTNNGVVVREKGEWEDADDGDGIVCPVCRGDFCVLVHETERFNFRPNCGADMRRRENDGGL